MHQVKATCYCDLLATLHRDIIIVSTTHTQCIIKSEAKKRVEDNDLLNFLLKFEVYLRPINCFNLLGIEGFNEPLVGNLGVGSNDRLVN